MTAATPVASCSAFPGPGSPCTMTDGPVARRLERSHAKPRSSSGIG